MTKKAANNGSWDRKYPYEEWLDGQPRKLEQGVDFAEGKAESVYQSIHNHCRHKKFAVELRIRSGDVYVQRIDPVGMLPFGSAYPQKIKGVYAAVHRFLKTYFPEDADERMRAFRDIVPPASRFLREGKRAAIKRLQEEILAKEESEDAT